MREWIAKVAPAELVWFCLQRALNHSRNSADPEFRRDAQLAGGVEQHWKDVTYANAPENKPVN